MYKYISTLHDIKYSQFISIVFVQFPCYPAKFSLLCICVVLLPKMDVLSSQLSGKIMF